MDLDLQSSELKLHIDVKKLMLCYKYTIFLFQIKEKEPISSFFLFFANDC